MSYSGNSKNPFEVLDKAPLSWYHGKNMLVAAMGTFTDGYDLSALGPLLGVVLTTFGINPKSADGVFWATWLNALPIFGFFVGAPVFGYFVNKGRKKFYGIDVALMSIGAGLQFFAQNPVELAIFRFIMGIGLGADYVLSPMIIAEHSNARDRGRLMAIGFGGFWVAGSLAATLLILALQPLVSPNGPLTPDLYWRTVLAVGAIPPLLVIYARRKVPETPRFLATIVGDREAFKKVVKEVAKAEVHDVEVKPDTRSYGELISAYLPLMLVGASLWFLFDIPAYGLGFFVYYISNILHFGNPALLNLIGVGFTYIGALVFWLAHPRLGSKKMEAIGFAGMAASFFAFAALMYSGSLASAGFAAVALGITLFGLAKTFGQIGPGSIVAVGAHGVELMPTKIRGIGHAVNVIGGRLGVLTTTFVLPSLLAGDNPVAFVIMGTVSLLGVLITIAFLPETANRGLEEITGEVKQLVAVEQEGFSGKKGK